MQLRSTLAPARCVLCTTLNCIVREVAGRAAFSTAVTVCTGFPFRQSLWPLPSILRRVQKWTRIYSTLIFWIHSLLFCRPHLFRHSMFLMHTKSFHRRQAAEREKIYFPVVCSMFVTSSQNGRYVIVWDLNYVVCICISFQYKVFS